MNSKLARSLAPFVCIALVACNGAGKGKAPTGQVVATVAGQEITINELRAELAGAAAPPTPAAAKAMEQGALQQIVVRKLMANAAKEQGLDKTPDFAILKMRANDTLLAQALQRKIAATAPVVSREDALNFVNEHPGMFAGRKLLTVDQIRMPRPKDLNELKQLEPLHSLGEVEAYLNKKNITFQKTTQVVDSMTSDPNLIAQLDKLPPGEPFLIPAGGAVLVNQIRETRASPFTGDPAIDYAMVAVRNTKVQEILNSSVNALIQSNESKVKYNDAYKPSKPIKIGPAAKPAIPAPAAPAAPAPKT